MCKPKIMYKWLVLTALRGTKTKSDLAIKSKQNPVTFQSAILT